MFSLLTKAGLFYETPDNNWSRKLFYVNNILQQRLNLFINFESLILKFVYFYETHWHVRTNNDHQSIKMDLKKFFRVRYFVGSSSKETGPWFNTDKSLHTIINRIRKENLSQ